MTFITSGCTSCVRLPSSEKNLQN